MAEKGVFAFTMSVQEKILALLWQDKQSYNIYRDCIKPKYFQKSIHMDICRILFDYWSKYNRPPTDTALIEEVTAMIEKSKSKQKLESDYLDCIERIGTIDLFDYDYIKDKVLDFGKKQAMVEAIMDCAEIIEAGNIEDFGKIDGIIKNAQMAGEDLNDLGIDYWDGYQDRLASYSEEDDVIERFPTGMTALDKVLKGGLGRTEMGIVLAAPGIGKTTFMENCGANGLRSGKNVVHISLENNAKQIVRNYDLRMLGKSLEYINDNLEKCYRALGFAKKYGNGTLFVKKFIAKKASVDTIRMYLNKLTAIKGIRVDIIIIDYGALLKPLSNWNDKRNSIESNYEDEFNSALWSGAQGNRGSLSKKIVTMGDLAEAFAIANTSDVMVALCQTIHEKADGIIRAFLTKNRDGSGDRLLAGKIDYESKKMELNEDITDSMTEDDEYDDNDSGSSNNGNWKDSGRQRKTKE